MEGVGKGWESPHSSHFIAYAASISRQSALLIARSQFVNFLGEEITMKQIRLYGVLIIVLLSLVSMLVMAQDATTLPANMEDALVPCGEGVAGPCDQIATAPEDIVASGNNTWGIRC
jgi:hypothetical protein